MKKHAPRRKARRKAKPVWITWIDENGDTCYGGPPPDPNERVAGGTIVFSQNGGVRVEVDKWGPRWRWLRRLHGQGLNETFTTRGVTVQYPETWHEFVLLKESKTNVMTFADEDTSAHEIIEKMSARAADCIERGDHDGLMFLAKAMDAAHRYVTEEKDTDAEARDAIASAALQKGDLPTLAEVMDQVEISRRPAVNAALARLRFDWLPKIDPKRVISATKQAPGPS